LPLQVFIDLVAEFGLRAIREAFRKRPHPAVATVGYLFSDWVRLVRVFLSRSTQLLTGRGAC
jgi:hypothetical protein